MPETHIHSSTESPSSSRIQLHVVIMFLITTLGGYVQVKYQFKEKSPFDEHVAFMASIFVSLCLYAASLIAEFTFQCEEPYFPIIKTFGPLVGFLVVVLLLTILMPLLGLISFIVCGLFTVKDAILSFPKIVQCLRQVVLVIDFDEEPSYFPEEDENGSPMQSQV